MNGGVRMDKKRILLIGTCSSGSTALGRCFLQRSDTHVLSQVIKDGVERNGDPNYSAFFKCQTTKPVIFNNEVFGWRTRELCTFRVLPDPVKFLPTNVVMIFLFRNPVAVWNGWVKRGWDLDIDLFFAAYEHLYAIFVSVSELPQKSACGITIFDRMRINPAEELQKICNLADIQYEQEMLDWQVAWGKRRGGNTGNPDIDRHSTFAKDRVVPALIITQDVEKVIVKRLGNIWEEVNKIAPQQ